MEERVKWSQIVTMSFLKGPVGLRRIVGVKKTGSRRLPPTRPVLLLKAATRWAKSPKDDTNLSQNRAAWMDSAHRVTVSNPGKPGRWFPICGFS